MDLATCRAVILIRFKRDIILYKTLKTFLCSSAMVCYVELI